jgi:hypothetical protein
MRHHHQHQPFNVPTAEAQVLWVIHNSWLGMVCYGLNHNSALVLTGANDCKCSRDNGLTCILKHGGARDNKFLVTHPMTS